MHTFDVNYSGGEYQSRTTNLMDYAAGAELAAFQWNIMANPAPLTWFDSEQEGMKGVLFIMAEGRVQMPFRRLGMGKGVAASSGVGIMFDVDAGKIATFYAGNLGIGIGGYLGGGLVVGWYPNAEIEDLGGAGVNIGFAGSSSTVNAGAELNYTTDYSSESITEFIEKVKLGGNFTMPGLSGGVGGAVYFEVAYIHISNILEFENKPISELAKMFNQIGLNVTDDEALQIFQAYYELWYAKNQQNR